MQARDWLALLLPALRGGSFLFMFTRLAAPEPGTVVALGLTGGAGR